MLKTEGEARGFQHFPADINSVTSLLVPFLKQYQFSNKNQFKLEYEHGVFRDIAVRRFKEVLKTEGEHFPADIKSVTSLLEPFLKQYQFSNKISLNLNIYESISVRLHSAAYHLPPTCCVILTQSPWPAYALVPNSKRRELSKLVQKVQ